MQAVQHRRYERPTAAAIYAAAIGVAAWVFLHRAPVPPLPPVASIAPEPQQEPQQKPQHEPDAAPAEPSTVNPSSMAIELVELPANLFSPAPTAKPVTQAAPAKPPIAQAPAPQPPVPQPEKAVAETPVKPAPPMPAPPAVQPPPVQMAEAKPVPPPKPQEPPTQAKPVMPLQPEARPVPHIPPPHMVPLQPEAAQNHTVEMAEAETPPLPFAPLRPGDEKPVVKPTSPTVVPLRPGDDTSVVPKPAVPTPMVTVPRETPPPVANFKAEEELAFADEALPMPKAQPAPIKPETVKPVPVTAPPLAPPLKAVPALAVPPSQLAAPKATPAVVINQSEQAGDGRALLKIFEQGYGPGIEIKWPSDSSQRERLYGVLVHCLGMRDGIVDGEGHLYLGEGDRNQPSVLNTDKYSGFVRRPEGAISEDEQREIARVRAYHQNITAAPPARIFPRRVDAFLIGGLRQTVGEDYLKMKSIRATYRLNNGRVMVESIIADGHAIDGVIDLSTVASGCSI